MLMLRREVGRKFVAKRRPTGSELRRSLGNSLRRSLRLHRRRRCLQQSRIRVGMVALDPSIFFVLGAIGLVS